MLGMSHFPLNNWNRYHFFLRLKCIARGVFGMFLFTWKIWKSEQKECGKKLSHELNQISLQVAPRILGLTTKSFASFLTVDIVWKDQRAVQKNCKSIHKKDLLGGFWKILFCFFFVFFFSLYFNENLDKLYKNCKGNNWNCKIRKKVYLAIFALLGTRMSLNAKPSVHAELNYLPFLSWTVKNFVAAITQWDVTGKTLWFSNAPLCANIWIQFGQVSLKSQTLLIHSNSCKNEPRVFGLEKSSQSSHLT